MCKKSNQFSVPNQSPPPLPHTHTPNVCRKWLVGRVLEHFRCAVAGGAAVGVGEGGLAGDWVHYHKATET